MDGGAARPGRDRMRTLIGIVGYRTLRDHSAPFVILDRLEARAWPSDVTVEDISYNPIAVIQWLQEQPEEARFTRAVLVSALERAGRAPGTIEAYRWDRRLPTDDLVQQAITDAVTGIIAIENSVIAAAWFRALPPEVAIVEIEPRDHAFGFELSDPVAAAIDSACTLIEALALEPGAIAELPARALRSREEMSVGAR